MTFLRNKIISCAKNNQFLYLFEKSYCYSRILRQICYNLVIKIFKVRAVRTYDIFNWQVNVIKKPFELSEWFSFHRINVAENVKVTSETNFLSVEIINWKISIWRKFFKTYACAKSLNFCEDWFFNSCFWSV